MLPAAGASGRRHTAAAGPSRAVSTRRAMVSRPLGPGLCSAPYADAAWAGVQRVVD